MFIFPQSGDILKAEITEMLQHFQGKEFSVDKMELMNWVYWRYELLLIRVEEWVQGSWVAKYIHRYRPSLGQRVLSKLIMTYGKLCEDKVKFKDSQYFLLICGW